MRRVLGLDYKILLALAALLILPVISRDRLITFMDQTYVDAFNTMERHFNGLYLSEHLRNLTSTVDSHVTRFVIWKDKEDIETFPESTARFKRNLELLKIVYRNEPGDEKELLKKIEELETKKVALVESRLMDTPTPPVEVSKFLKEEFQPLNTELKTTIDRLIESETRQYWDARTQLTASRNQALQRLTFVSVLNFFVALTLVLIVFRLIQRLRKALKETQKAVSAREDILAVVSHDLKNPLTSININSQVLLKEINKPVNNIERMERSVFSIQRSSNVMLGLIQSLLDQVKLESGRLALDLKEESFKEVLRETESVLIPLAEEKSIKVSHSLPADDPVIKCDKKRFMQVLSNILGNAIKFLGKGDEIIVEAHQEGKELLVSIRDTGPGIPEEDLPHLFDRYWQARKTAKHGTGLGLSIVKDLIEAHGGKIWVKSRLNQGTTFTFSIPTKHAHI